MICTILPREEMPVDLYGNVADIVMCGLSTFNRTNPGRFHEQFINAVSRDTIKRHRKNMNLDPSKKITMKELQQVPEALRSAAWENLMGLYEIVTPEQHRWFVEGEYPRTREEHMLECLNNGIVLYIPPDNPPDLIEDVVSRLSVEYPPDVSPVTYTGLSGNRVTTVEDILIGEVYMLLLEKIGDDWAAVSSGKYQIFGVLGQLTNANKFSQPTRQQATRTCGEAEVRILLSYCGPKVVADIMDRNNNPSVHKEITKNILRATKPTNIKSIIDRKKFPLGQSKPLQQVKHITECAGFRFVYKSVNK